MKDYYAILGVAPSAEEFVIRAAWKAMAQRYHPDRFDGSVEEAHERMAEINEAYDILSDSARRSNYDGSRMETVNKDHGNMPAADPFENDWLQAVGSRSNFRNDPQLIGFARQLLFEGNKDAARALSDTIRDLSDNVPSDWIINRICEDFNIETKEMWKLRQRREAKAREDAIWEKMREKARAEAEKEQPPPKPPPAPPLSPPTSTEFLRGQASFLTAVAVVVIFVGLMILVFSGFT